MTLAELIESGKNTISTEEAAKIIGIHPITLRNSIQMGTCPFAFLAGNPKGTNRYYVVSVLAMVNWLTGSHYTALSDAVVPP